MLGTQLHSLAMLNLVTVAGAEPLAQVKKLLQDLVLKLQKEGAEAATVHSFCQEEKKKTTVEKAKKTQVIDKLRSRLDKAAAEKESLQDLVAELGDELAAIDKANAEAQKIRSEEKAANTKVIADFKAAADAVEDALGALKDFYGDSSLLQGASAGSSTIGKL